MKILFVTLSNIGDCILTLPVLDGLLAKYPAAAVTCLVPQQARELFELHPAVRRIVIFDKRAPLRQKIKLFSSLAKEKFDLVVDMRNSFFGAFLPAKKSGLLSGPLRRIPPGLEHSRMRHLYRALGKDYPQIRKAHGIHIKQTDCDYVRQLLGKDDARPLLVVAPGAKSITKCWSRENFASLCSSLAGDFRIALVGDKPDEQACAYVKKECPAAVNLCGKTNLTQLAALLTQSKLAVSNDSAVMHLASYLNVPVVAIFGPTDEKRYGPWSEKTAIAKKQLFCRPCSKAVCRFGTQQCLKAVKAADVLAKVKEIMHGIPAQKPVDYPARILLSRTDRLGDVLLSTPAIRALRKKFPQSYISVMVTPYTREAVEGNPDLDEVIVFDKEKNKGLLGSVRFAKKLKQKKFDLAVALHPSTRVHLLFFLAGIRKRMGYDRKLKFLLTDYASHAKQYGQKHESRYAIELLDCLGLAAPGQEGLFMPIRRESEEWALDLLKKENLEPDKLLLIHPAASCKSKIWPASNFARVADALAKEPGFNTVIVASAKDTACAQEVAKHMRAKALNLAGKTSISQLASLIKRARLFISTDSGPVHIASALNIPQITIFGRSQPGLGPKRWGPLGERSRILHKSAGCTVCLAHDCKKGFACINAVSAEEVIEAARELLALK